MSAFPQETEGRLLELLARETELFGQLNELMEEQAGLLAADNTEAFNRSLDAGRAVIEKINGLHQETEVLMQSYMSFDAGGEAGSDAGGEHTAGGKSGAVESARARLNSVIAECAELTDKNMAAAKEKTEDYIRQIGNLSLRRKSFGKYALGVPNDPELFDKKT